MTDPQMLILAIAIIAALSMVMNSGSRVTEAKETLRAEAKTNHVETISRLTALDTFLREAVMTKLDELDRRLTALEGRR
jgi:hypothetical protein